MPPRARHLTVVPAPPAAAGMIKPGHRCGWPDPGCRLKLPDAAHIVTPGHRELWTGHTVQCQLPNPNPDRDGEMTLDGYPACCMATEHGGRCCYRRHIMDQSANDHRIIDTRHVRA